MKAPEKIYVAKTTFPDYVDFDGSPINTKRIDDIDIEYTRTDAFIEKALKWYCLDCECNDNCKYKCAFWSFFKDYLEGNNNAIPPKFDNAINPDGSTTENYRYRHFIIRMQDTFIEKARKWFEQMSEFFDFNGIRHYAKDDFEDFRKYMEGE